MVFPSFEFLAFFLAVILLLLVIPSPRLRKFLLLTASYAFYAYWDYRFVALIFVSTVVDYLIGRILHQAREQDRRRLLLWISILSNLGFLGFFKYYGFFVDSANAVLTRWDLGISNLEIILPVGISFYTFQTMSYTLDIYRGKLAPVSSLIDFALFVAFFPQLVAGPIVRAADFLPQLGKRVCIQASNVWAGSQIFIVGLFKKLMIADAVSPFVDAVFAYPEYYSSPTVWLAVVAYALQIYCDFSGYSDMAIGCARILGFRFDRNFDMPYLARNVTEFWRRWHISLSGWLRDYLYVPLGGNRRGQFRTCVNVMIVMILGGLWHGASWNFVVWGALHGFALVLHRLWSSHRKRRKGGIASSTISAAITFLFVTLAWVLFRAQDTQTTLAVYSKLLFLNATGAAWYYHAAFAAIGWSIIGHAIGRLRTARELVFFRTPHSYRAAFATVTILLIIYVFAPTNVSPFIYFQF